MSAPLALRPATPADWPAVRALLAENALPLAGAQDHLDDYLMAGIDGQVVGCAGLERRGDVALLRSVAVQPARQHAGIGRQLVQRLMHEAAARGVRQVFLLTIGAADYFARLGFRPGAMADAPPALRASAEFRGACPASATLMSRSLNDAPASPAHPT